MGKEENEIHVIKLTKQQVTWIQEKVERERSQLMDWEHRKESFFVDFLLRLDDRIELKNEITNIKQVL